ncbi:hypothetical protein CYY_001260 [Polysphondylium violaceum]|uniref:Mitochondrial substrate carrier family protein n=1 Tax=Polysphondylium violaceum TaxID=133409 RepID=A0A8J4Q9K4_9MYCE|nr:hypothetical protein CYY_001260 [Polysphondylium violaceum]
MKIKKSSSFLLISKNRNNKGSHSNSNPTYNRFGLFISLSKTTTFFFITFLFIIWMDKAHAREEYEFAATKQRFEDHIPTIISDDIISHHKPKEFNLGIEMLAGTMAGVSTCILFYPLELIEAKIQVASSTTALNKGGSGVIKRSPIGPFSIAKSIFKTSGIKGFYQGLTPTALGNSVNWGVYFSVYRYTNHWWNHSSGGTSSANQPAWVGHSFSAITAGLITTAIVNPFWVLKIRLATSRKYNGMSDAFQSIIRNEGVKGLWKGVGISFFGVSEGLVQFVTYEYLLEQMKLMNGGSTSHLSMSNYLIAGGTSRLVAGLCTYPYLLIRSSLQSETCPYKSMSDACRQIYKHQGLSGFYKGIAPNLARSIPPAAFMLYIVEFFRNTLTNTFIAN